jgi:hypothetical protein
MGSAALSIAAPQPAVSSNVSVNNENRLSRQNVAVNRDIEPVLECLMVVGIFPPDCREGVFLRKKLSPV